MTVDTIKKYDVIKSFCFYLILKYQASIILKFSCHHASNNPTATEQDIKQDQNDATGNQTVLPIVTHSNNFMNALCSFSSQKNLLLYIVFMFAHSLTKELKTQLEVTYQGHISS